MEKEIGNTPDYIAISYVWGEPVFLEQIYTEVGHIKVTPNASAALLRQRQKT